MKVYTCKDRLTDIMTCIYDAWSEALRIGHNQIQLKKEPVFQQTLFDEYIHIDGDFSKAEKVIRSIRRNISEEAYLNVYYATLCAMRTLCRQSITFCVWVLQSETPYLDNMPIHMS